MSLEFQFALHKIANGDLGQAKKWLSEDPRDCMSSAGMAVDNWPQVLVHSGLADEKWFERYQQIQQE